MADRDLAAAARRHGLDRLLAAFPVEIAAAVRLAREQAAALGRLDASTPVVAVPPEPRAAAATATHDPRATAADAPLHYWPLARIGQAFAARTLDPPAYLDHLLARIAALDRRLHSFVVIDGEGARAAARESAGRWASGAGRGALDGIPAGIKDMIDVAGLSTRGASRTTDDAPAAADAGVVTRLRRAGAVIVGKLATHEFAIGGPAFDLPGPPARNPWHTGHHPGGSSSGAGAAVAAGFVPLAVGTDTAGSVRHPASACGIVGLKPGRGALPLGGVMPLSPTLDHAGLLTRSVADLALAAATLGITVSPAPARVGPTRVGYVRRFHTRDMAATPATAAALDRAAALLGATEVELPPLGAFALVNRVILQAEGFAQHAAVFRDRPAELSALTRAALLAGAFTPEQTLRAAYRQRQVLTAAIDAALTAVDVLLTASSMEPACRIDDAVEVARTYMLQARGVFNVTGHPALAMMAGLSADGLPLSVQFAGRMGEEARLLAVAAAWEAAIGGPVVPPGW